MLPAATGGRMDRLHARYPFLSEAREAVREADIDLASLVAAGGPAVERGVERVTEAIDDGTVGQPHRQARVELLSYPIARLLVSLVDEPALTRRYATAEARTAADRLREDAAGTELRSADRVRLSLRELLSEFDLASATRERSDGGFEVAVTAYLPLAVARSGDTWRLVNRQLTAGEVPISRAELFALLETAVERRVAAELPFAVPEAVATELEAEKAAIGERLGADTPPAVVNAVVPEDFPPCMTALLTRVRDGEDLPAHSRFAITGFLAAIGMDTEDVVELFAMAPGFDPAVTRYQVEHLRGTDDPVEYVPPSCATMQSYGDCVNMDELCETIAHPLSYYETAIGRPDDGADRGDS